ncbi:MAG: MMPL family transporter [Endomicrobiales bacterium]|nr:MMPL family transporter [Endomicrobiales bacterium]
MLIKIAELIKKRYKIILAVSFLFTALCIWWISKLELNMRMEDMLPKNQPTVVAYQNALDNFVGIDLINVAIEGREEDIISYIEDTRHKVSKLDNVDEVIYKSETDFIKKHGFLLLKERELESIEGMLTASSLKDFVGGLNDNFEKEYIAGEDSDKMRKDRQEMLGVFNTIEDFLNTLKAPEVDKNKVKKLSDEFLAGPKYMISSDRSMGLMFVKTDIPITEVMVLVPFIDKLEGVIKDNQKAHNVKAGIGGFLVLQRDEMNTSMRDMKVSSILSIIFIFLIFLIGFKLIRYTILAIIPLIIGIIWSMGLTYIFVGWLNSFTAMMGAILIGLGIDYAIHIIALYTEERHKGTSVEDSITKVYEKSVKGIITGSITTSIGFMMFVISTFPAFREFGFTLGIGIICTLLASIFILPSLLLIFGRKEVKRMEEESVAIKLYESTVVKRPSLVIIFIAVLLILSAVRFKDIEFSRNLKDIEAKGLESLEINDKMIEKFDFSNDITLGITKTIEEAHKIKDQAEDLDTVGMVQSIANYIPVQKEQQKRMKLLAGIKKRIKPEADSGLHLEQLKDEIMRLEANLIELSDLAYIGGETKIVEKIDKLVNSNLIQETKDSLDGNADNLVKIQKLFIKNIKKTVLNANSSKKITLEDIPRTIKENYIGKDGTFLTTIYPKEDVWTNEFQPLYVAEIQSLDMPLTGSSLLSIEVMNIAASEGKKVLLLVVCAIFIILLIDFRSLKFATFAMMPMAFTLVLLVGVMVWTGMKFDYVNIIALPIIIGIGVDDGVHLIHRYLIERNIVIAMKSTGRAILLTTLTTMAAFGTMIVSKYQGFGSFGKLLIIGIGWAFLLTVLLLSSLIKVTEKASE